ncbi:hypothetical protein EXQ31_07480 [Clostridium botulinum]|uniref:hypothetical protein n=1 Tax=Clostridium TaxID=1485 RepID=UPI0013D20BBA|nr:MULTISPECIES: hypothetical protein [Clostridium]MBO0525312.1 hypothetical protein [Clostridium botulinum]MBO0527475.1 hypothetical protein [Clostridium botulinum]MBO0533573.1 hypothetical protein [Clostridium botulinum]MBO0535436.1 hypothetical protein [Clostridium botulinum]MBO0537973.1 hypothetical protein [Clostridium botulinum]
MDITTVRRTQEEVGSKVFGREYEFGDAIHGENYYKELEEIFYNRIIKEVKKKLYEEFLYQELDQESY